MTMWQRHRKTGKTIYSINILRLAIEWDCGGVGSSAHVYSGVLNLRVCLSVCVYNVHSPDFIIPCCNHTSISHCGSCTIHILCMAGVCSNDANCIRLCMDATSAIYIVHVGHYFNDDTMS